MKNLSLTLILFLVSGFTCLLWGQMTVTGTVTDPGGEPLIGVSILISGTTTGVISDLDGKYSLQVPSSDSEIQFTYTGFESYRVQVGNQSIIDVTLQESNELLDEVIVVGYGTSSKRNLTDNVAKIGAKEIENIPVSNFQSTLSGKASGVRVTPNNGKVDAGINIQVRGTSSISAGSQPLYVLDGVPLVNINESSGTAGPLNPLLSLSPTEIESIEILKDASSAAIYGARGANGVVIITTKRGKSGKASINLNVSRGTSSPTNLVDFLNTDQYLELFREAAANEGLEGYIEGLFEDLSGGEPVGTYDTDWNDVAFRDGSQTNVDFSVSGGDKKTTYYFGGSYANTEGILVGNDLDRIGSRINIRHSFNDKFTAGLNLGVSKTSIARIANDNAFVTPLQAIAQAPISPARLPDGTPFDGTLYPNFLLEQDYGNLTTDLRRITGKAFAEYKILSNLKFNTDFGYDFSSTVEDQFRGSLTPFQSTNGEAFNQNAQTESYVFTNYLTFTQDIGQKSLLTLVGGMEFNDYDRTVTSVTGTEFPSDDFQTINSAAEITSGTGFVTEFNFLSYFGRATFLFNDRYVLKASIRRDGSSRFGSNNRFGTFPAVSAGWIISEENFLKGNSTLSFLKARVSYGRLGNSEIGNFPSRFLFGGVSYNQRPGLAPTQPGNNDLTWEKSDQLDIGIEFGFFDNRISGEIDFYNKQTDGLLFSVPLPGSAGATSINQNIGLLESQGVEFVLNTQNLKNGALKWNTSFNIAFNENEIISLPNDDADIIAGRNINRTGESINSFYLPEFAGVDPDNGDALYYLNTEGSERQTTNSIGEAQRIVAGQPNPEWIAGLTNSFMYKGFELDFTFVGEWGASIYNSGGRFQSANGNFEDNQTTDQLNRWQQPGDITNVPQARLFGFNGYGHSTRWLESASFIRLRNLSLGYNLPESVISKAGISRMKVYVTGTNLLTFTDYLGYDPEARSDSGGGAGFGNGQAFYSAPLAKTLAFGINLNF
ncbi:MAG: TonB-dependent receptor [Saprospiraceae bacterium]